MTAKARLAVRRSRLRALAWFGILLAAALVVAVRPAFAAQDAAVAPLVATTPDDDETAPAPLDPAWLGDWIGSVGAPPSPPGTPAPPALPVHLRISLAEGAPRVVVTSLRTGALAKPAIDVVANGALLGFTLEIGGTRGRFEAKLLDDRRGAEGLFAFIEPDGRFSEPRQPWSVRKVDAVGTVAGAKVYAATLDAAGQKLPMRIALADGPLGWCGAIEIASQGLRDFPLDVARTADGFLLTLDVGVPATMELAEQSEGAELVGLFSQGAFRGPVRFALEPGAAWAGARRPQDPVAPLPYAEREVVVAHPAGHALAGTLVLPADRALARDGRFPLAVLVTGSGPQNRDEEILGHRPFAVIADALARAGVASFRYDDRGVGRSTGDFAKATGLDLASDADIVVETLRRDPAIDPARVGIVGHSEGAMIAPVVAMWQQDAAADDAASPPLAFTVLLAPPAEDGGATLTRQSGLLYEAAGVPDDKAGPALEAHAAAMRAIREVRPDDEVRLAIAELVRRQLAIAYDPVPPDEEIAPTIEAAVAQVTSPWMVEFIRFDPRPVLARLRTPSLALCGLKDLQVDATTNLGQLDRLAKESGTTVTTRRLDGLNHLFQPAVTGLVDEYGAIETTFDPAALAEIVAWVVERTKDAPAATPPAPPAPAEAMLPARLWRLPAARVAPAP
jgi:hypothetical protein